MTILVFGKTGQVATEIARLAPDALCLGRDEADLADPDSCAAAIARHDPRAVINAAAYTAVDRAEGLRAEVGILLGGVDDLKVLKLADALQRDLVDLVEGEEHLVALLLEALEDGRSRRSGL